MKVKGARPPPIWRPSLHDAVGGPLRTSPADSPPSLLPARLPPLPGGRLRLHHAGAAAGRGAAPQPDGPAHHRRRHPWAHPRRARGEPSPAGVGPLVTQPAAAAANPHAPPRASGPPHRPGPPARHRTAAWATTSCATSSARAPSRSSWTAPRGPAVSQLLLHAPSAAEPLPASHMHAAAPSAPLLRPRPVRRPPPPACARCAGAPGPRPWEQLALLRDELAAYSPRLAALPALIVANKARTALLWREAHCIGVGGRGGVPWLPTSRPEQGWRLKLSCEPQRWVLPKARRPLARPRLLAVARPTRWRSRAARWRSWRSGWRRRASRGRRCGCARKGDG